MAFTITEVEHSLAKEEVKATTDSSPRTATALEESCQGSTPLFSLCLKATLPQKIKALKRH